MASGLGAGSGADMLQDILRRKLVEQAQIAQQQQFAAKMAEDVRQANMQNDVQRGNLALGNRRTDEDSRQFNEQAPVRMANVRHLGSSADALDRQPVEADKQRTFTSGEADKGRTFQGGQGDLNRQNAVRIANIQGQNALNVAMNNHPAAGQSAQQANEVQDTLDLIDRIGNDPALEGSVGQLNSRGVGYLRDPNANARFKSLHDQLVGKMSLAQAGKLKGQGQISDKERAMLASAATALNMGLGSPDYRGELGNIRGQFERMATPGAIQPVAAHAPGAGGGPKAGDVKVFPNGKKGVWDGQGWVSQ